MLAQFGITKAEYERLLEAQGGVCAICGGTEPGYGFTRLLIDHNHTTNALRGLLCAACNTGLGNFREDLSRLRVALTYLSSPPARTVAAST